MNSFQNTKPQNATALYVRTSTVEQCCENQRPELVRLAAARGLDVVAVYEEQISGATTARPEFSRMMADAHKGVFSTLVVWALDRLGRSMIDNIQTVLELDRIGVRLVSVREPWLDTAGPVRGLLLAIFSWCAEQERLRIIERTKAGMLRAKAEGKVIGRPPVVIDLDQARVLRARGLSLRQAARQLGVGASTLCQMLRQHDAAGTAAVFSKGATTGASL
jgi:DNA invertase Pin-like site-specific DNA recombinase